MKWRRFPRRLLVMINFCVGLLALLGSLARWVSPVDFGLPGVVGMVFPLVLLGNVFFLAFWLLLWLRPFWISFVVLLLVSPLAGRYVQLWGGGVECDGGVGAFRVLSYNVNLFRLYSWSSAPPSHVGVARMVDSLGVDAVCFQEFLTVDSVFSDLSARSSFPQYGHVHYISRGGGRGYGLATFSRYPIVDSGHFTFSGSLNGAIFTDLDVGWDTLRLYNLHLQSFRLRTQDMAFLRKVEGLGGESFWHRSVGLLSRVLVAMKQRAGQVDELKAHMARSPHPVVVCGDFNDAPLSYTYERMRAGLRDAFVEAGLGFGTTYRQLFPSYRIDYTLYSAPLVAVRSCNPEVHYSDHYPVLSTLVLDSSAVAP